MAHPAIKKQPLVDNVLFRDVAGGSMEPTSDTRPDQSPGPPIDALISMSKLLKRHPISSFAESPFTSVDFENLLAKSKDLPEEFRRHEADLERVLEVVKSVFAQDAESAATFMTRRHMLLGGKTPLELAWKDSAGADSVIEILNQYLAGCPA